MEAAVQIINNINQLKVQKYSSFFRLKWKVYYLGIPYGALGL